VYWRFLVDFAGTEARADANVKAPADAKVEAPADAKVEAPADAKVEEQDESRAMNRVGLARRLAHRRMRSLSWCRKMRSSSWPQNRPYRRSCGHTN